MPFPETATAVRTFVSQFEACTLPKREWTHAAHVLVGAVFCCRYPKDAALRHMRQTVRAFNESVGGKNTESSGYHETMTRFWLDVLAHLRAAHPDLEEFPFSQLAVERFGQRRDLHTQCYDFDLLASTQARLHWIAPKRPIQEALQSSSSTGFDFL